MPLSADKLPLLLTRKQSKQPPANALPLTLNRKLGEASTLVYVSANALPLPLERKLSEQPPANALPLPLTRPLGTLGGSVTVEQPPAQPRRMLGASALFSSNISQSYGITTIRPSLAAAKHIGYDVDVTKARLVNIRYCLVTAAQAFVHISNSYRTQQTDFMQLSRCFKANQVSFIHITTTQYATLTPTLTYPHCHVAITLGSINLHHIAEHVNSPTVGFVCCASPRYAGKSISQSYAGHIVATVPVPCRYYPVPEPPPPKPEFVCRIRPPSSQLALPLSRRRLNLPASSLPMPLMCWHDAPPRIIPSLRSYIVHNTITATIGGIKVDPISFDIKAEMSGFCWLGSIEIATKDFAKIKAKLDIAKGSEPLIIVTVNNKQFSFIAEQHSRSRQFVNHSHKLSGRSISARLGADYAKAQGNNGTGGKGLLTQANYASQIVNQQLNGLSVSLAEFAVTDWLIPANTYAVTGKTPLAVISDIAEACGGFIVSDLSGATLSIKPRWKVPAWKLATATADVTLPWIGRQVDDQNQPKPRYNTVTLTGNTDGGIVYRSQQGRDLDAPTQSNALYTAREVIVPAGTAILSDSGNHRHYTLTLRQADKYDIPLANLGDIWQINDPEGFWRGVVTGVSFGVKRDNLAPVVWQTLIIDRYVDV